MQEENKCNKRKREIGKNQKCKMLRERRGKENKGKDNNNKECRYNSDN